MAETVALALKRLKLAQQARSKQLQRETDALKFQVPELQWDDDMKATRKAATVDGMRIPARPMLSIPKLNQPIALILNQEKNAQLGVNVSPLSEHADDDTAEVIRDLYRREEQRSRAGLARSWAFDRAVKAGFGVYAIDTCYDEESDHESDQRIRWRRILYQNTVYFDPSAQEPDWSDMQYAFELAWQRASYVRREFPKAAISAYSDSELRAVAKDEPEWVKFADEQDEPMVLLAVYWHIEHDGKDRKVMRTIMTGTEELLTEEWNGRYIPLIPVIGSEVQPFDDERRWMGVIEPAMGAQRLYNYAASAAVELAATETKAPYQMYEGQDEGYEEMWRQSSVRNFPALVTALVYDKNGNVLPHPQRTQVDVGRLGPSMALLDKADQFIQASTTTLDQTQIEALSKRRVAHQTIASVQEQSDLGNSHFLQNLATISLPYEAKVVIDLMATIYDRPGRVARLLDLEDNERAVMLNQPFRYDEKKRPVPVDADGDGVPDDQGVKHYDLKKGRYGVSVTIGKRWQDRLQQGANEMGELLKDPELMLLLGPIYMKFRDFPGAREAAEVLKRIRAIKFPGIDQDPKNPQAQQDAAALAQENQMLKAHLQQVAGMVEKDQLKIASNERIAGAKLNAEYQMHREDNETKLAVAEFGAKVDKLKLFLEERARLGAEQHEQAMGAADAEHDQALAQMQHQQALQQASMAHDQAMQQAEQGQMHTLESQQQAADLAPKSEAE